MHRQNHVTPGWHMARLLMVAARMTAYRLWVVVTLAIVIGSVGQTSLAQAAPPSQAERYVYLLTSSAAGRLNRICVGDLVVITVKAERLIANYRSPVGPDGTQFTSPIVQVAGVRIDGLVGNPDIGTLTPTRQLTSMRSDSPGSAEFKFVAKSPGTTGINFTGVVFQTLFPDTNYLPPPPLEVKVIPCKFKVEATSRWNNNVRGIYLAMMDETELRADAEGRYIGSANVNWIGTFMMDSCPKEYTIPSGQADLTGELNDSGQLTATLTYQPVAVTENEACGNLSGWSNFQVSQDPLHFSVPASGGAFVLQQFLKGSGEMGIFDGSVTIIVIPLEDETAAFNPSNRVMDNGFSSTWATVLWHNFPWLYDTMLAVH